MTVHRKAMSFALMGIILVGAVLAAAFLGSAKGNKAMNSTKDGAGQNLPIPPIDAAIPEITETATFSLG